MAEPKGDLRERTKRFALRVVRMFSSLPKTTEARGSWVDRFSGPELPSVQTIGKHFGDEAEFIAKCGDCLRVIEETAYWLKLLVDGNIVAPDKLAPLRRECDELTAIFVTIIKRSKQ